MIELIDKQRKSAQAGIGVAVIGCSLLKSGIAFSRLRFFVLPKNDES